MELRCASCTLRPFRPTDAESLARHADDRRIWLNLRDRFPHPFAVADAERYIDSVARRPRLTSFAIDVAGDAVGNVSLRPGDDVERLSAEIGYWLGAEFWARGIMSDAVRAATRYAFDELALTRVFAVPFARNPASFRVLEKAGYVREGILRRSAVKEGEVLDQYMYASVDGGDR
jgi:[ribosomal protein S5]-alanine N-acetyltransferase